MIRKRKREREREREREKTSFFAAPIGDRCFLLLKLKRNKSSQKKWIEVSPPTSDDADADADAGRLTLNFELRL